MRIVFLLSVVELNLIFILSYGNMYAINQASVVRLARCESCFDVIRSLNLFCDIFTGFTTAEALNSKGVHLWNQEKSSLKPIHYTWKHFFFSNWETFFPK